MSNIGEIAIYFTFIRDQIKFYHWTTKSYSRHVASDSLVTDLSSNMDKFIEVMQGSENKRLVLPKNTKMPFKIESDSSVIVLLEDFKKWLISDLPTYLSKKDTDLLNIRDEILADVNKTLYLFSLS